MKKVEANFRESENKGYSILTLQGDSPFSIEVLNQEIGGEVEKLINRLRALSYLPIQTEDIERHNDGVVNRKIRKENPKIEVIAPLELEKKGLQIKIPTYLTEEGNAQKKMMSYIEEFRKAVESL